MAALLLLALPLLSTAAGASAIRFHRAAADWGVDFRHHNAASGRRYMVETMVGGVVVFDYDGDGDEDLFFVDGGALPGYTGEPVRSRLFRNDGGHFTDWTERSGIKLQSYGMGGTAGDVDGDGDLDLYVTTFNGPNQLFRNNGDGTFTDVTAKSGLNDPLWSSSAAFADVDNDGDLDLYVANYVDFNVANNKLCGDEKRKVKAYCHPDVYNPLTHHFYRNRGDGTFEDATRSAGFGELVGPGLGVVFGDVDNDGW